MFPKIHFNIKMNFLVLCVVAGGSSLPVALRRLSLLWSSPEAPPSRWLCAGFPFYCRRRRLLPPGGFAPAFSFLVPAAPPPPQCAMQRREATGREEPPATTT